MRTTLHLHSLLIYLNASHKAIQSTVQDFPACGKGSTGALASVNFLSRYPCRHSFAYGK